MVVIRDSMASADWIKTLPGYQEELELKYGNRGRSKRASKKPLVVKVVKPGKRGD